MKSIIDLVNAVATGETSYEAVEPVLDVLFDYTWLTKEQELALFRLPNAPDVLGKYLKNGHSLHSKEAEKLLLALPNAKELFDICLKNGYVFSPEIVETFLEAEDKKEFLYAAIDQGYFMGYRGETVVDSSRLRKITSHPDRADLFIRILKQEKRAYALDTLRDILCDKWIDDVPSEKCLEMLQVVVEKKLEVWLTEKMEFLLLKHFSDAFCDYWQKNFLMPSVEAYLFSSPEYNAICEEYIVRRMLYSETKKLILKRRDAKYWVQLYAKYAESIIDAWIFWAQYYLSRFRKSN